MSFSLNKTFFFGALILLAAPACKSGGSKADCPTLPQPIFSDELAGVSMHDFIRTGTEALEVVAFDSGVFLEVFQSGCDTLLQEFRFQLPDAGPEREPAEWLTAAQAQFNALGALGPQYLAFKEYAQAMERPGEEFRLAEPMELAPGFWAKVDKIESFDGATLVVVLSNQEL
jgi:hypothetical protein